MPINKTQKIIFSVLMSFLMVYGMETYNHFIAGYTGLHAFSLPIIELLELMFIVIILQTFIGGRFASALAFKLIQPESSHPLKVTLIIQLCTVIIMCPLMSCVATIIFKQDIPLPFLHKWMLTILVNFPFALFYQVLVAGPVVRKITSLVKV
jgi:hypothetical protein